MHMKIMYNPIVEEKFYLDEVCRTLRSAAIVMVTLNHSGKWQTNAINSWRKPLCLPVVNKYAWATYHSEVVGS